MMNIEQGISNYEVKIQLVFNSTFIIPCSLFNIYLNVETDIFHWENAL